MRFKMSGTTWTSNSIAAFVGGTRYYAFYGESHQTTKGTWYYANSTSATTTTGETCPFG